MANELTQITVGSLSVDAMVGHFDAAAPGVGAQFLENASTYDERYAGTLGIEISMQKIARALERAGAGEMQPSLVLDVGSGSGNSVFALAKLFPEAQILALDLSPNMVAIIQRPSRPRGRWVSASRSRWPTRLSSGRVPVIST